MKKWNTPDVTELNINETANGSHNYWNEGTTTYQNGNYVFTFTSNTGKEQKDKDNDSEFTS